MLLLIIIGVVSELSLFLYIYKYQDLKQSSKLLLYIITMLINVLVVLSLNIKFDRVLYPLFLLIGVNLLSVLAIMDLKTMELDSVLIYCFIALSAISSFFIPEAVFWQVMIFAVTITGILWLISIKSKKSLGLGDVKVILCIALMFNINKTIGIIFLSLLLSLVVGLMYIFIKKGDIHTELPFVPFLLISTIVNLYF